MIREMIRQSSISFFPRRSISGKNVEFSCHTFPSLSFSSLSFPHSYFLGSGFHASRFLLVNTNKIMLWSALSLPVQSDILLKTTIMMNTKEEISNNSTLHIYNKTVGMKFIGRTRPRISHLIPVGHLLIYLVYVHDATWFTIHYTTLGS